MGEDAAARRCLVLLHVVPQLRGILAVEHREGAHAAGLVGAVREDHDPVQVVAIGLRGPFEAGHGSEDARLVVGVRQLDELRPDRPAHVDVAEWIVARRNIGQQPRKRLHGAFPPAVEGFPHFAPALRGQEHRAGFANQGGQAHRLGMIREDQEIERPDQPEGLAGVRHDRLAARSAIDVRCRERRSQQARIRRQVAVDVHVAEKHLVREVAECVGRVVFDGRQVAGLYRTRSLGQRQPRQERQRHKDGRTCEPAPGKGKQFSHRGSSTVRQRPCRTQAQGPTEESIQDMVRFQA